jgi:hypothetical protein
MGWLWRPPPPSLRNSATNDDDENEDEDVLEEGDDDEVRDEDDDACEEGDDYDDDYDDVGIWTCWLSRYQTRSCSRSSNGAPGLDSVFKSTLSPCSLLLQRNSKGSFGVDQCNFTLGVQLKGVLSEFTLFFVEL